MKANILFVSLLLLVVVACQKEETSTKFNQVNGIIQKGPFISGTTIMIQELDPNFNPSGKSYTLMTNDDFGSFLLQSQITSEYIEIIATGYYFNEINGKISDAPLTLRAISNLNNDKTSNVNILTTLAKSRILFLIKNENKSFDEAKKQSENEILEIFKISVDAINFNELDISKDGMSNGILLAISAILQGKNSVGELSEFISKFNLDFEPDGIIQSQDLLNKITANAKNIDVNDVYTNLNKRYSDLSLNIKIPPFELFVKKLCPLMVVKTSPKDNEEEIAFDIDTIKIVFNKSINDISNYIILKDSENNNVPIKFSYDPLNYQLNILPEIELSPEKQYSVVLDNQTQANDGDHLVDGYNFSFKTVNIDILSNLIALYLFKNNTEDSSGKNNHALLNGGRFCTDKNGNENSALELLKKGDYLQMFKFNLSSDCWTYSTWVYLNQYPQFIGSLLATSNSSGSFWEKPFYIGGISGCLFSYNRTKNPKNADNIIGLNQWIHVSMVINNKNIKFYINGQQTYELSDYGYYDLDACFPPFDNMSDGYLYVSEKQYYDEHTEFIGLIDNVRFYGRALNKYEILKLYNNDLNN